MAKVNCCCQEAAKLKSIIIAWSSCGFFAFAKEGKWGAKMQSSYFLAARKLFKGHHKSEMGKKCGLTIDFLKSLKDLIKTAPGSLII